MNLFTQFPSDKSDEPKAISVTRLLRRMRNLLEIELGQLWVEGEVSNLRQQSSGHWYFTLKDEGGQIACAMFGARRKEGHEVLEDGAKVRVLGEATLYEARGTVQLVILKAEALGAGALQARFEALKKKLDAEGLFDPSLKKKLPPFPTSIGLVTSGSGAALQDMLNILSRRAPWLTVYLYDVQVQGKGAEAGIARAIERLGLWEKNALPQCDVLIVGRGGGSLEDLWNFNEEIVARAIAACPIPIISAVGHEIDFTIADFAADLRAPTPSAAAELVVPDGKDLLEKISRYGERLARRVRDGLERRGDVLKYVRRSILQSSTEEILRGPMMRADDLANRLEGVVNEQLRDQAIELRDLRTRWQSNRPLDVIERHQERLERQRERLLKESEAQLRQHDSALEKVAILLRTLGPDSAFERGFSITLDGNGQILRSAQDAQGGTRIETLLKGGLIVSRVE